MESVTIRAFYDQWPRYERALTDVVAGMSAETLALRPAPDGWPIWATVAHTAGTRVYWLCGELGEPGAEATPFPDPMSGIGWEDDLATPRDAEELVMALQSGWRIVESCLDRWTPDMLSETFVRKWGAGGAVHSRGSILQRLFSHDAYHCGELSQTLGVHRLPQIDLWPPGSTA
jgi:hypothetical protein